MWDDNQRRICLQNPWGQLILDSQLITDTEVQEHQRLSTSNPSREVNAVPTTSTRFCQCCRDSSWNSIPCRRSIINNLCSPYGTSQRCSRIVHSFFHLNSSVHQITDLTLYGDKNASCRIITPRRSESYHLRPNKSFLNGPKTVNMESTSLQIRKSKVLILLQW